VSGKLATDACQDVETISSDGFSERKSMVYTEYFARGTAPTTYCTAHQYGDYTRVAGGVYTPAPERPAAVHLPEPVTTTSTSGPAAEGTSGTLPPPAGADVPPPTPEKKRGFWSRIFGRDRDRNESDKSQKTPPKKKSGG
jgi:hypothetical protein